MVEALREAWARSVVFCLAGVMSLMALIFCWFIWRAQRRERIKVAVAKFFEAVGFLVFGPLDEEVIEQLNAQQSENHWR